MSHIIRRGLFSFSSAAEATIQLVSLFFRLENAEVLEIAREFHPARDEGHQE